MSFEVFGPSKSKCRLRKRYGNRFTTLAKVKEDVITQSEEKLLKIQPKKCFYEPDEWYTLIVRILPKTLEVYLNKQSSKEHDLMLKIELNEIVNQPITGLVNFNTPVEFTNFQT
mgnify:CR=1 FL=1